MCDHISQNNTDFSNSIFWDLDDRYTPTSNIHCSPKIHSYFHDTLLHSQKNTPSPTLLSYLIATSKIDGRSALMHGSCWTISVFNTCLGTHREGGGFFTVASNYSLSTTKASLNLRTPWSNCGRMLRDKSLSRLPSMVPWGAGIKLGRYGSAVKFSDNPCGGQGLTF